MNTFTMTTRTTSEALAKTGPLAVSKLLQQEYVVLELQEATTPAGLWKYVRTIEAASAAAAIRAVAEGAATYVAVPARSWKPLRVRSETQTVLRLEEASD